MLVKIQRSLTTSWGQPQMLVYNQDRTLLREGNLTKEVKDVMGVEFKVYAEAVHDDQGNLKILHLVEDQPW